MIRDVSGNILYWDESDIQQLYRLEQQIKELKALIENN